MKKLKFGKVEGKENAADLMTKNVPRELAKAHCDKLNVTDKEGRHPKAPELKD